MRNSGRELRIYLQCNALDAHFAEVPMSECDWKLLAEFSQLGSHTAFAALVKRYHPLVEATCTRILGSGGDADDVVQAAFFKVARCAEQLTRNAPVRRSLAPWLTRVATNICHDIARSRTARRQHELEYMRRCASPTESTTTGQLAPLVDELIAELPQQLREPIVLCYLQGIKHARAAEQLGLTVGTLRRRIQSAKSMLRSRLAARGVPISMFLLHVLMDTRANGANALPAPAAGAQAAAELPAPQNQLPPQVSTHPFASLLARPAVGVGASWAIKAGLIAVAIGMIPVLYGVLSGDAPAFATVHAPARATLAEIDSGAKAVPSAAADVAPRLITNPMPGPEATPALAPGIADLSPSTETATVPATEVGASPGSAPQTAPVVESTIGTLPAPGAVPETETVPAPGASPAAYVASESDATAPEMEVKTVTKKSHVHSRKVKELFGIDWHMTLESASAAARREQARPIFCFRVLGDLSGFM